MDRGASVNPFLLLPTSVFTVIALVVVVVVIALVAWAL